MVRILLNPSALLMRIEKEMLRDIAQWKIFIKQFLLYINNMHREGIKFNLDKTKPLLFAPRRNFSRRRDDEGAARRGARGRSFAQIHP